MTAAAAGPATSTSEPPIDLVQLGDPREAAVTPMSPWLLVLLGPAAVRQRVLRGRRVLAGSARRSVVEPLAVTSARARATLKAMEDVSLMMACAQLGITVCAVLLGALGEPAVAALLEPVFHRSGVPRRGCTRCR